MGEGAPNAQADVVLLVKFNLAGPAQNLNATDIASGENDCAVVEGDPATLQTDLCPGGIDCGRDGSGVNGDALKGPDFHKKPGLYEA